MRSLLAALLCIALSTAPALAEPAFRVTYPNGIARVEIEGDWRHSLYTVSRAAAETGPFEAITAGEVLCTGACFADDQRAVGGRTYFYRFDLVTPDAGRASFGPYVAQLSAEKIRPIRTTISPNPGHGPTQFAVFVTGDQAAQGAEIALFDLQGRRQRQLYHGALSGGSIRLDWDGRSDHGRELGAGVYLLRVVTWDGRRQVSRVVRSR